MIGSATSAVSDADVVHVLQRFGHEPSRIERVERIPRRLGNVNFRVRSAGGEWVVKSHASPDSPAGLELPHLLETTLGAAGFPVAELQHTADGGTLVEHAGRFYSVNAWVSGHQIEAGERWTPSPDRRAMLDEAALQLGRLHRLSFDFEFPARLVVPKQIGALMQQPALTTRGLRRVPSRLALRLAKLRLNRRKSAFDRWILHVVPDLIERSERLAARSVAQLVDPGDTIVVHNDVNWENLIFGNGHRLAALLDFDNAAVVPRALEVGAAAVALAGPDRQELQRFATRCVEASGRDTNAELIEIGMQLKCARSIAWTISGYLRGRVADPDLLAGWSAHLYDCLRELDDTRRSGGA